MSGSLSIETVVSAPLDENTYVVWRGGRGEALVIDPGFEPDLIFDILQAEGLTLVAILNTHGHADHIAGNRPMKERFPAAPLIIGAGDAPLLSDANLNFSAAFGFPIISPAADRLVREGEVVEAAGIRLEVFEVPGHSPGHVVFLYRNEPPILFGGDVLFRGSIGRTDFPNGSAPLLLRGIREKLLSLPRDTQVFSGHGPVTTIGAEKRSNPFVGDSATDLDSSR